jgi:hypothetical protein
MEPCPQSQPTATAVPATTVWCTPTNLYMQYALTCTFMFEYCLLISKKFDQLNTLRISFMLSCRLELSYVCNILPYNLEFLLFVHTNCTMRSTFEQWNSFCGGRLRKQNTALCVLYNNFSNSFFLTVLIIIIPVNISLLTYLYSACFTFKHTKMLGRQ